MRNEDVKMLREIEDVAALLGKSNEYIRSQCRNKKIKSSKIGKRWMIPQHEVDRLLMVDPSDSATKAEMHIAKLQSENRSIRMQLETVRSFLNGANQVLDNGY